MEEYDDNKPMMENGKWVTENGESVDLDGSESGTWKGEITPSSLKNNGMFVSEDGFELDIWDLEFGELGEVMAISCVNYWYELCPSCGERILDERIILMLEGWFIYPALCCDYLYFIPMVK